MPRPFWSGQIQISLVSFSVNLFPATEAKGEIHFHQLSRKTGERIHHQKVVGAADAGGAPAEKDDIVKGYEYRKGEYVMIEPGEIENLRIPSRKLLAVTQFVDQAELDPELYEKPYFVVPDGDSQAEAFTVIREALQSTGKAALGKIAFSGREHLVAIVAPQAARNGEGAGMMAYTLRYADELRKPTEYFSGIKKVAVDEDQLSLAKELISRKAAKFAPEKFKDEYEAALKAMVEAKVNNVPMVEAEPAVRVGKGINLMDALRKSVGEDGAAPARGGQKGAKGIALVKDGTKPVKARKTA
jgi:DNA end-binding protein Ku